MDNFWQKSRGLIGQAELSLALTLLCKHLQGNLLNEVMLYQTRLAYLQKEQKLFNSDESKSELLKLSKVVLDFILTNEEKAVYKMAQEPLKNRVAKLRARIKNTYQLLEQWEEKMMVSENPSEQRRSQMEIKRLHQIVQKHLAELTKLEEN